MVTTRIARVAFETMADSVATAAVQRLSAEAAAEDSGSDTVRIARMAIEVMASSPAAVNVQRLSAEAAVPDSGSDTCRIARMGIEVMAATPVTVVVQRLSAEAAAEDSGSDTVRIARMAMEVMAKIGVPQPVPLPLQTPLEFYSANWQDTRVIVESSYLTDITASVTDLGEERRSLAQRPARHMTVRWTNQGRTELDRLVVFLRKMTSTQVQMPLFCDQTPLTAAAASGDTTLTCVTNNRRLFIGGRIIIVPSDDLRGASFTPIVKTISGVVSGTISLTATVGQNLDANKWMIFPFFDCDIHLAPAMKMPNDRLNNVTLTFTEHKGRNSLPPIEIGLPSGWQVAPDGKPIFLPDHNWKEDMQITYRRVGKNATTGRKTRPTPDGTRYVQVQEFNITTDRAGFWPILGMFDTRQGRGQVFWGIDQETIWNLSDTDPGFIDVLQFGTFSDFNDIWTETGVGAAIVMNDGTIYVREINTVQDNGGSWRLTLVGGQTLPDPIDLTQVRFFARARHTRFLEDALLEEWYTDDVVEASFSTIEVPNEADLDLDP